MNQVVILQEAELGHSVVSSICERYLASSKSATAEDKLFDHREWFKQKQMMLQYVQLCCAEVGLGLEAANERMDKVIIQLAAKLCKMSPTMFVLPLSAEHNRNWVFIYIEARVLLEGNFARAHRSTRLCLYLLSCCGLYLLFGKSMVLICS